MRRQRTTPILVIAILHLIGGGLGLLLSLCSCGGLLMIDPLSSIVPPPPTIPARPGQPPPPPLPPNAFEVMKYLNDHVPGYRVFTIVGLALSFLLDIMLISGGIGLLRMRPWARWLSLVYAPISIFTRLGSFVYSLIWVMPATEELYAKTTAALPGFGTIIMISKAAGVFGTLLVIIYPISVFIILVMPSTVAAFRNEAPVYGDDWPDEKAYGEDHWRRPPRSDQFRR